MAKRYIEANALIQDIEQSKANNNHNNSIACQTHNAEHKKFIKMVLDQPTADVVEVVRCKDCGMSRETEDERYLFCMQFADTVDCQAFCSYGTPKERSGDK